MVIIAEIERTYSSRKIALDSVEDAKELMDIIDRGREVEYDHNAKAWRETEEKDPVLRIGMHSGSILTKKLAPGEPD